MSREGRVEGAVALLERVKWNQSEAARLLGLHRNTLKVKLARWKIREPEPEP